MKTWIPPLLQPLLHLLYPHYCEGCHTDLLLRNSILCTRCEINLPTTGFGEVPNNPVEKIFRGRLSIEAGTALYFFTQDSLMQHLITLLKYKNNPGVGRWLGKKLGYDLLHTARFNSIDCIIPLPLHPKKEFIRGYNQAQMIAEGLAAIIHKPVLQQVIVRNQFTRTQTQQNRNSRWDNMQGVFSLNQPERLVNKHCLLVDDVITTGATLVACGNELTSVSGCRLSIATAAFTSLQP